MSAQDFQSKVLMDSSLIDMASYVPESSDAGSGNSGNNGNNARASRSRPGDRRMLRGDSQGEELQSTGRKLSQTATVVDWVAANKVTAVKNQGSCGELESGSDQSSCRASMHRSDSLAASPHAGSCWAFAATAAIESAYLIAYPTVVPSAVDLAEQQLISCSSGSFGCSGGYSDKVRLFSRAAAKDRPAA